MALYELTTEIVYLYKIITDIKDIILYKENNTHMFCDSETAIKIAKNPEFHDRTKHIDVKYHYIREIIDQGNIKLSPVRTQYNNADLFTKPLGNQPFHAIIKRI
jgi:hypothetical protein